MRESGYVRTWEEMVRRGLDFLRGGGNGHLPALDRGDKIGIAARPDRLAFRFRHVQTLRPAGLSLTSGSFLLA